MVYACVTALLAAGCSPGSWRAGCHMVEAENAYSKAYDMRVKKELHDQRLVLYRQVCSHSLSAYHLNPKVFTLQRIEMAQDACFRVENHEAREMFLDFLSKYEAEHPTEVTYGDAFPQLES